MFISTNIESISLPPTVREIGDVNVTTFLADTNHNYESLEFQIADELGLSVTSHLYFKIPSLNE